MTRRSTARMLTALISTPTRLMTLTQQIITLRSVQTKTLKDWLRPQLIQRIAPTAILITNVWSTIQTKSASWTGVSELYSSLTRQTESCSYCTETAELFILPRMVQLNWNQSIWTDATPTTELGTGQWTSLSQINLRTIIRSKHTEMGKWSSLPQMEQWQFWEMPTWALWQTTILVSKWGQMGLK